MQDFFFWDQVISFRIIFISSSIDKGQNIRFRLIFGVPQLFTMQMYKRVFIGSLIYSM